MGLLQSRIGRDSSLSPAMCFFIIIMPFDIEELKFLRVYIRSVHILRAVILWESAAGATRSCNIISLLYIQQSF